MILLHFSLDDKSDRIRGNISSNQQSDMIDCPSVLKQVGSFNLNRWSSLTIANPKQFSYQQKVQNTISILVPFDGASD